MYYANNKRLPLNQGFKLNNLTYPANFLTVSSKEQLETLGITWKEPPIQKFKNKKYYYNTVDSEGVVVSTPKDLDMLKRGLLQEISRTAHSLLVSSDWMVIRENEADLPVSKDWVEYRSSVRDTCNLLEAKIKLCASIEDLEAVKQDWPQDPNSIAEEARREAERLEREEND